MPSGVCTICWRPSRLPLLDWATILRRRPAIWPAGKTGNQGKNPTVIPDEQGLFSMFSSYDEYLNYENTVRQQGLQRARRALVFLGVMVTLASIACGGSVPPTATPTAAVPQGGVLTAVAVSSTPPTPPTAAVKTPTATPTGSLNGGTALPSPAGTMETDCSNVYQPVVNGATWTYLGSVTGKSVNTTWTQVETIFDVSATEFSRHVNMGKTSIVDIWRCTKEGLVAWSPDSGLLGALAQGPNGLVTVKTTAVTGVALPASLSPGDVWQQRSVLEITDPKGNTYTGEEFLQFRAVGPEDVTVPAGNFNAQRMSVHAETLIHAAKDLLTTFDGQQWMVPELGLVKRSGELVLFVGQAPHQLEFELQSYQIP